MADEEEDDYLNMTFEDPSTTKKETSLQRIARLKKEAADRSKVASKAELAAQEKAKRDAALATEIDSSNKGARMMAKMGFKPGDALGQSEDARKQPIELLMKDDRGGIGMDSEKKRKVREAAEQLEEGEKRQKVSADEFRQRNRVEREERRAEGQVWGAMKVLEGFEEGDGEGGDNEEERDKEGVEEESGTKAKKPKKLSEVNLLYRPLVKQRVEKDRERQMKAELNDFLSTRDDEDSDLEQEAGTVPLNDDEDEELADFEALPATERLEKVVNGLRDKYYYCFWCKHRYPDAEMEGCPGLTEDEHG